MKQWLIAHRNELLIAAVIIAGCCLRLYQLGQTPSGLGWDEAAIGYNGWSVWTTRRDEWLNRLPISFRSFGDYKAPLAIYLNGPFTLVFGMNAFAVRLPFALFACATLIVWWRLLEQIRQHVGLTRWFVRFGVAVLAFSPWHIVFSRIAFESGICLFFVLLGVYAMLRSVDRLKRQLLWLIAAGTSFAASLYTYHSAKIVVPLLVVTFAMYWRKELWTMRRNVVLAIIAASLLIAPLLYDSIMGQGATRAGDLIFVQTHVPIAIIQSIVFSLIANLDPSYTLLGQHDELRHVTGVLGILLPGTVIFSLIGLFGNLWLRRRDPSRATAMRYVYFALWWWVIGLSPGLFSVVYPHANRTLLAMPGLLLLAAFGFEFVAACMIRSKTNTVKLLMSTILAVDVLWALAFMQVYFTTYRDASAPVFQTGYQQAVAQATAALRGGNQVDQVVFSSAYGQPYIYVLFYNKISPIAYHQGALVRYLFVDSISVADLRRPSTLLIFTPRDPLAEINNQLSLEHKIERWADTTAFYVLRTAARSE